MALVLKDRVKETTTTTGTADFTLGGAATGFQSFSVIGNGNTTYYAAVDPTTGDWEVGVGTYSTTGPTLTRDSVLESSNAGSKVVFAAGSKDVFCTYPAERSVNLDAAGSAVTILDIGTLGVSTANISTANITSGTVSTTPTSSTDIANKTYVDTQVSSGITYHSPVKYEVPNTTGNLTANYNQPGGPGVGVGATLTNAGTLAAFAPDGPTAQVGDRILVYNQTNAFENGVYTVTTVGSGAVAWVLTRATDADTYAIKSPNGLGLGDAFFVTSGDTGAGETYVCNTSGTITFGTTNITFVQISSAQVYSAGTGLNLSPATTFNISNTGVTASTYGSGSNVPVFAVNAQGQITSVTNTAIAISAGAVSGLAASATTDTTDATNITSGTLPSGRLNGSYTGVTGVGTLTAGTWNGSTIAAAYGGTGLSSYAVGDLIYADTTTSLAKLADVVSGNVLLSGGVGTAPAWGQVGLQTHVTGTLQVTNGGTGATTLTGYIKGNGTSAFTASASIPNSDTTATSANTANTIVARDSSGNFSAGTITASLSGNATSATTATSATSATTATYVTAGMSNNADDYMNFRVMRNNNSSSNNDGMFIGYANSNSGITRIYGGGATSDAFTKYSNYSYEPGSFRAPIFYDSSDTAYYGDFAGNSKLYTLEVNGANANASTDSTLYVSATSNNDWGITLWKASWEYGIQYNLASTHTYGLRGLKNGTEYFRIGTDLGYHSASFRAPIFYDSDNTGYYVDPNSSTQLRTVYADDWFRPQGDTGLYFQTYNYGLWSSNSGGNLYGNVTTYGTGRNGYTGYGLGSRNTLMTNIDNGGSIIGLHDSTFGWIWRYIADDEIRFERGYSIFANSARAPIFYDSNDTSYYINPNSSSYLWSLTLSGGAYFRPNNWIQMDGNFGIYWPGYYGAHLYPTTSGSYTQLQIDGSKNSYSGMYISHSAVNGMMYDGGGNGGVYREASGRWYFYYHLGNDCMGIGSSTTNSAFNLYFSKGVFAGGRADATTFYAANNTPYYLSPGGTSYIYGAGTVNTSANVGLNIVSYGGASSGAIMHFHRSGYYAINIGLDADNVVRLGGWSSIYNRWQSDTSGNFTAAGSVTAYSDVRLKKDWVDLPDDFVERLAMVKAGTYTRIDNGERQAGCSAQDWQELLPEVVLEDAEGVLSLAYGNAAVAACVALAKSIVALRAEVQALRRH